MYLTVGREGEDISPPGNLHFQGLARGVISRLSRANVSMPWSLANSFTTWPPFLPGTPCLHAKVLQLICLSCGHCCKSCRTMSEFQQLEA